MWNSAELLSTWCSYSKALQQLASAHLLLKETKPLGAWGVYQVALCCALGTHVAKMTWGWAREVTSTFRPSEQCSCLHQWPSLCAATSFWQKLYVRFEYWSLLHSVDVTYEITFGHLITWALLWHAATPCIFTFPSPLWTVFTSMFLSLSAA